MKASEANVLDLLRAITHCVEKSYGARRGASKADLRTAQAAVKELCKRGGVEATDDDVASVMGLDYLA